MDIKKLTNILVKDIMHVNFKTVKDSDDLKEILLLIYGGKRNFFPVVHNEKLAGVIDSTNLNEYILLQSKLSY